MQVSKLYCCGFEREGPPPASSERARAQLQRVHERVPVRDVQGGPGGLDEAPPRGGSDVDTKPGYAVGAWIPGSMTADSGVYITANEKTKVLRNR
jgi:hypothetical protein